MAKAAATRGHLCLLLYFDFLWSCLGSSLPKDTHSLSCNFTVKTPTKPRQSWYEGYCLLDGVPFFRYDNVNKTTPLGDLGKAANATPMWTDLTQRVQHLGYELRMKLADTKLETTQISGHPTLQTTMNSLRNKQGLVIHYSWQFNISGKPPLLLDTRNKSRTSISPEWRGIMSDEQFIEDLKKMAIGDSGHWFQELSKLQEEMANLTSRASDITEVTPPSQLQSTTDATQPPLPRKIPWGVIFFIIAGAIVIFCFCLHYVIRKCCPQAGAPCCSSSSVV